MQTPISCLPFTPTSNRFFPFPELFQILQGLPSSPLIREEGHSHNAIIKLLSMVDD